MGNGGGGGGGWINFPLITQHRLKNFATFSGPHPSPDIFSKLDPSLLIDFLQSLVNWSFSKTEKKKNKKTRKCIKLSFE